VTEASRQPKDKNYNLISVLYQSSDNAESLKIFVQDAEAEGDQELVEFFDGILENNLEAHQRRKKSITETTRTLSSCDTKLFSWSVSASIYSFREGDQTPIRR